MGKNKYGTGPGGKSWVHPPEALTRGHIVYNCKFLGHVEVEQPKGTDVVKDAIRKMKFNKQIKKAEGVKSPKVELTISVNGVTVQEPKYKMTQHQYPLHRISYCADDKSDKRMFTFIAKEADNNNHHCFVFDSEKCAEEITLTIGQAFDLAYKRFLETSGKDIDTKKQYLLSQKKIQQLTQENLELKARVADLERLVDPKILSEFEKQKNEPTSPNRNTSQEAPTVGRKLENLIFDEDKPQAGQNKAPTHTNGISTNAPLVLNSPTGLQSAPRLAPPPPVPARQNIPQQPGQQQPATQHQNGSDVDLFGAKPFTAADETSNLPPQGGSASADPFGMGSFTPKAQAVGAMATAPDLDQQIQNVDRELMDLQTGFSQGLSFGSDDFSLDDLDPLKN